jgi:hypothetical protein
VKECAQQFSIPNMTDWCPPTLLDLSQLRAFYVQTLMEEIVDTNSDAVGFPGAIYIDALDTHGRIRTGPTLLSAQVGDRNETNGAAADTTTGYGYVDTVLLYNVQRACAGGGYTECAELSQMLQTRKAAHPHRTWDDPQLGRHKTWPYQ